MACDRRSLTDRQFFRVRCGLSAVVPRGATGCGQAVEEPLKLRRQDERPPAALASREGPRLKSRIDCCAAEPRNPARFLDRVS